MSDSVMIYGFILILVSPFFLIWAIIIFGPVLMALIGGAMALYCFLRQASLIWQSQVQYLARYLFGVKDQLTHPVRVCACYKEIRGVAHIAVQYISDEGSFSHHVKAREFSDAVMKIQQRVKENMSHHSSCGSTICVMKGHCPNRIEAKNKYTELFMFKSDNKSDCAKKTSQTTLNKHSLRKGDLLPKYKIV